MGLPTAAEIANAWSTGMANSGDKFKRGVQAVTESPTEKAAQQVEAMVAGITRAASEGKIQAGLRRVTLEQWKQSMLQKGAQRIASGAQAAKPKMQAFAEEFLPHLQSGMDSLKSMPRGSLEQNLQRANALARHNANFRRSR